MTKWEITALIVIGLLLLWGLAVPLRPEEKGEVRSLGVLPENTWMYGATGVRYGMVEFEQNSLKARGGKGDVRGFESEREPARPLAQDNFP